MFADDNCKFDENGRKLSKHVENTVGKGEIARYEQFILFPQCFQKVCFQRVSRGVIVWEWVNPLTCNIEFLKPYWGKLSKTVGKGENAVFKHFLISTMFSTLSKNLGLFVPLLNFHHQMLSIWKSLDFVFW